MKKVVAILLAMVLTFSFVLTGCSSDETSEGSSDETKSTSSGDKKDNGDDSASDTTFDGTFPLEEQITLTLFVHARPNVDNFNENAMTEKIEKMTNINLEFVVATENEAQEKLNLLLATGDYPDLLLTKQLSEAQQALYGSQGVLLPLNDLIDTYGENTKALFADMPIVEDRVTMTDGNIYNLPTVNECYHCYATQKLWIYQPWLDKLGLDMPQTTDEYYEVLKAFATEDPNGNGKADEIPLAGAIKGWEASVEMFLMNSFVYTANQSGAEKLLVDNGTVTAAYATEGWKDGMKYLQMLREEGLLAPESFTQAGDGLKQMGENPDEIILGSYPGGAPGVGTDMSGDRWRDYVTVPALEGPTGLRQVKYNPFGSVAPGLSITDKCEYPEIAMALADLLYSEELSMDNSVGPYGTAWEYVEDDSLKGINGEAALWNELIPLAEQDPNLFWNQMGNGYRPSTQRLGRYNEDPNNVEVVLYKETKANYEPYFPEVDVLLPPMVLTEEQSSELLTYSTSISDFVKEKTAEFIVTDIDIDAAWDSYLEDLNNMGLPNLLGVYQEAYDAQ